MPKSVDRAARQEEILRAAATVFADKGFAATRVEDVAAAAGIAKGSVYLYFPSRDSLLAGVFDSYARRSARVLAEVGDGPALDRLERLIRGALAMLAEHPEHARVLLDVWAAKPPIDMVAVYGEYRATITALLREAAAEGTVRDGVDERYAAVIVGAIEGCLIQSLVDPSVSLPDLAEPVVRVCLTGIRR
ncbi:TetR/AcrR family transcriptional regulator [Nocardia neocaledoniensis]|uniref:TetR/AcrR family transcriptional regulator n=1 Tax=Nocardia neocaledoniensis TaxID=236511 RepID=UPI0024577C04|nr:TetR/AcrR family transcriptional regulator [Nocardia neocaledoniensis]